ncbi:MAG TPA: dihydroorotase [archaeon]|nr:dihydroorotase [archaeon]
MSLALLGGKAYLEGTLVKKNLLIENGKITKMTSQKISAQKEIDCTGKIILPGAIDVHVHFRVPGFEYKEDWVSGSLAAIAGGVTTVMDMPNTNPPTDTLANLEQKRAIVAKDALVNFDLYMAATENNLEEIGAAKNLRAVKLYFGSTTGDILFNKIEKIRELFKLSARNGFIVVAHAEDETTIRKNSEHYKNENSVSFHPLIRDEQAEVLAIAALLKIQKEAGNKFHVAHISSKKGVELVKEAKAKSNGKITCEVTPHHLLLDSTHYKTLGNLLKCNPSVKGPEHRKALFSALKKGTIDIVSTDHAPHSQEEKAREYLQCPSGVPGVETLYPIMLDQVNRKKIGLEKVVEVLCENPAAIFNWPTKGFIKEGFDADLVIVDMEKKYVLHNEKLFTKAKYTPFADQKLKGFVENTIVGGEVFG